MPLYTFYPCQDDETPLVFETHELHDDEHAAQRAKVVLSDHLTAAFVVVWLGDRRVCSCHRRDLDPNGSAGR